MHTFFSKSDFLKFFDQIDHRYEAVVAFKKHIFTTFLFPRGCRGLFSRFSVKNAWILVIKIVVGFPGKKVRKKDVFPKKVRRTEPIDFEVVI